MCQILGGEMNFSDRVSCWRGTMRMRTDERGGKPEETRSEVESLF